MKRFILFSFLVVLFTTSLYASASEIELNGGPILPGPKPLSLIFLPVSASIDETQLSVYFELSVGDATITVYDESDQVIYQETVDTDSTPTVFISSSNWSAGNYSLTITYNTTRLRGDFQM